MSAVLKTPEERHGELLQERALKIALIANAERWMDEMRLVNYEEYKFWRQRRADLELQVRETDARMRAVLSQDVKDRYAGEREAARREDAECVGASNGAVDWESL